MLGTALEFVYFFSMMLSQMNRITNITKRQIQDLFCHGVEMDAFEKDIQLYHFSGTLTDGEFLERLYDIKSMPSLDSRFDNASGEIWQHTVNNDDYDTDWVFDDERFPLKNGTDEDYLRFLMEVLSPEVRIDGEVLTKYIERLKSLLAVDGYELYISSYVSNHPIYTWGLLTEAERISTRFLPFSIRNKAELRKKKLSSISKRKRSAILDLMKEQNEFFLCKTETGYDYWSDCISETFNSIKSFYKPMAFNPDDQYVETDNYEQFIMSCKPQHVFDAIELYPINVNDINLFPARINQILSHSVYKLIDRKMRPCNYIINVGKNIEEKRLKELVEEAHAYIQNGSSDDLQHGLEKIWDAYERAKTLCHKDKKTSIGILIDKLSGGDEQMKENINAIMSHLSWIGNNYQIRHFEKDKLAFPSDHMKVFYFNLCASFLNLCINYIDVAQE